MAQTAAERQARRRKHVAGDHSECDPKRCRGDVEKPARRVKPVMAVADVPAEPPVLDEREPGGIEKAVASFVGSLGYSDADPRSILGEVAIQLARRVDDTGALPAAVRELRVLLAQIAEAPNAPAGQLDEFRVQRARRRVDALITKVS